LRDRILYKQTEQSSEIEVKLVFTIQLSLILNKIYSHVLKSLKALVIA